MRVAIVHDWLVVNGGAEKVLASIVKLYPDADIYTLVDFLDAEQRETILQGKSTHTSFIQKLPFSSKHFRNYLPFFTTAIESFDLSEYDLILSSSWAVAKGVKKTPNQLHICYCHTPIRYAWDLYDEYTQNLSFFKRKLVSWTLQKIRVWDIATLDRVDYFIANSNFVAQRIQKTYKREAEVIYPPLSNEKFTLWSEKEAYYMTASRLVPYKKTKLIVEAFNLMPDKKLVVIGSGEEYEAIKKIAKRNITVLGYQKDAILIQTMQKAKAFVYGAIEDFGIIPVEALSCGTPVIALNDGGTAESIVDGVNGVHFNVQTKEAIIDALQRFESLEFVASKVRETTKKFTSFEKEFKKFVEEKCKHL